MKETKALISSSQNNQTTTYGTHNREDHHESSAEKGYSTELKKLLEKESRVPWNRIGQLSGLFLAVIVLNILQGSGEFPCGTPGYLGLQITNVVVIVLFAIYIQRDMVHETIAKQALSYEFADGDVIWDHINTWHYFTICFIAGLCAGIFGIGKCASDGPYCPGGKC